jgi:putative isomerase
MATSSLLLLVLGAASLLTPARSQMISVTSWPNTAYAPPSAGTTTLIPSVNLTGSAAIPDYTTWRFQGTVACTITDLITFSLVTDGGVRLWIDDHLVLDDGNAANTTAPSPRTSVAEIRIPFTAGIPQPIRLEYARWTGTGVPTVQLFWEGNTTVLGPVPSDAFTPIISDAELQRWAVRSRLVNPPVAWQTYDNPTMGAHVNMPSGFTIGATLADLSTNSVLGNIIVFRRSNPAVTEVGGHSLNGSDYTELHIGQWRGRDCDITFATTVANGGQDLQFLASSNGTDCSKLVLLLVPSMARERAGAFSAGLDGSSITADLPGFPSITLHAVGASPVPFQANRSVPTLALPLDPEGAGAGVVGYYTGQPTTVPVMQASIAAAKAVQAQEKTRWGPLADVYDPMASVLAWNTMFTPFEGVITPVSRGWDFGQGYVLFDWDNYFLSYMASIEGGYLKDVAYMNLIQLSLSRTLTGFVANYVSGLRASYDRTEPQIGAYVILQIYNKWQDGWIVDLLLPAMLGWNDWVWTRRRGEGIYAGADGYADLIVLGSDLTSPKGDGSAGTYQGARYESGLDNSPMYEYLNGTEVSFNTTTFHMGLYDVGMTALYLSDTEAVIQLLEIAGRNDLVPTYQARFDRVSAAMSAHMWDETSGNFVNVLFDGTLLPRISPTSFFPLISGAATDAQADAMMQSFTSPLGLCFNSSYRPDPNAAMLVQWYDESHDNAPCLTDDCNEQITIAQYDFIRIEAVALLPAAGPAAGLVALNAFYSPIYKDYMLTTNATGPDATYEFLRIEGYAFVNPPTTAAWPVTQLTLHYSSARKDYQVCGSPGCLTDTGPNSSYVLIGPLGWAWNGTGAENLICKYGGTSISRGDSAFYDNNYWRGRIWGPHYQLMYWALRRYDHVPSVRAARLELVAMGKALVLQNWLLFKQVAENVNGIIGIPEDVGNADPFYTWGALFGFVSFLEDGLMRGT